MENQGLEEKKVFGTLVMSKWSLHFVAVCIKYQKKIKYASLIEINLIMTFL